MSQHESTHRQHVNDGCDWVPTKFYFWRQAVGNWPLVGSGCRSVVMYCVGAWTVLLEISRFESCFYLLGFPGNSVGEETTYSAGDPGSISGAGWSAGERIGYPLQYSWVSLVAQLVKNPPAMWETWVRSLGWEDPLEKGKATHSSIWPGESQGPYSPWGLKELDTTEWLALHFI